MLGATGLTAYFGLFDVGKPKPGDTVVVSAASGAVGQIVGQLAKIAGCRTVVGLAGSAEKVADLTELYGYDVGIDYKQDDLNARLKEACPNGVDVYFDNVGGAISETVFRRLALNARVPVCGQISQYNLAEPELAPRNLGFLIVFRARLEGFLVSDYVHRFPEGLQRLGGLLADGKLRYREDVTEGLENAPAAFMGMLRGENRGKTLVKIADPSLVTSTQAASAPCGASTRSRAPARPRPSRVAGDLLRSSPSRPVAGISERPLLLNIA